MNEHDIYIYDNICLTVNIRIGHIEYINDNYIILYDMILYYIILYYTILYYITLYYIILYYSYL